MTQNTIDAAPKSDAQRQDWIVAQLGYHELDGRPKLTEIAGEFVKWDKTLTLEQADQLISKVKQSRRDALDGSASGSAAKAPEQRTATLTSVEDFSAVDEPGAKALLGTDDSALISEGADAMVRGDGGAGKTTLTVDMAFHLAGGNDWLAIPVARALRVLLIENEGPRPQFRQKLARKLAVWEGGALEGRLTVFDDPWGDFTFGDAGWRLELARRISDEQIDVVIAGPLTRLGMNEAGTLQQTRDFMANVDDVRSKTEQIFSTVLIHHDNKAGGVSGAWEGTTDTLLHVTGVSRGLTKLHVQKARWSSELHNQSFDLNWIDGEGFAVKDERDYQAELETLGRDKEPRTVKQFATAKDGGIGTTEKIVRKHVENPLYWTKIEGKDLPGKSPKGMFYVLR